MIRLNRIMISSVCLSMISSENRYPLFRIMLQQARVNEMKIETGAAITRALAKS